MISKFQDAVRGLKGSAAKINRDGDSTVKEDPDRSVDALAELDSYIEAAQRLGIGVGSNYRANVIEHFHRWQSAALVASLLTDADGFVEHDFLVQVYDRMYRG